MKKEVKTILISAGVFAVLLAVIATSSFIFRAGRAQAARAASLAFQDDGDTISDRSITVTGTGRLLVEPDVAVVEVGVVTQADTAGEALTENNEQVQAVIDALQEQDIPAENIQTQTIQLQPVYRQPGPNQQAPPEVQGFEARNIVQIRVENIDNLGSVLDTAVEAGGNLIQSIRFEVTNQEDMFDQLLEEAMNDAQQKATVLAGISDTQLGEVLRISTLGDISIPFGRGGGLAVQEDVAAVPVEPGTQAITATVEVTWRLE